MYWRDSKRLSSFSKLLEFDIEQFQVKAAQRRTHPEIHGHFKPCTILPVPA